MPETRDLDRVIDEHFCTTGLEFDGGDGHYYESGCRCGWEVQTDEHHEGVDEVTRHLVTAGWDAAANSLEIPTPADQGDDAEPRTIDVQVDESSPQHIEIASAQSTVEGRLRAMRWWLFSLPELEHIESALLMRTRSKTGDQLHGEIDDRLSDLEDKETR